MDWLEKLIDGATQVQLARTQVKAAQYQQLGERGYYVEGQPGVTPVPQQGGLQIPLGMALIAGGVLLVMFMMKD